MRFTLPALCLLSTLLANPDCKPNAPCYSADGIVNAASNLPGPLAPLTWVSIYGTALSYNTRGRSSADSQPGFGGVNVLVNNRVTLLSYVSPLQINLLLPYTLNAKTAIVQVLREGTLGPAVTVSIADCAPALFLEDADTAVAAHADPKDSDCWTAVTPQSPARAGELIVLYATGLGPFLQPIDDSEIPQTADPLLRRADFTILLNDKAVEDRLIEYAGAAPLFTGVYQINLRLPAAITANPEIRIALGDESSPTGIHLLAH
jgi:uncharacterized protein (TIGR03437 family)